MHGDDKRRFCEHCQLHVHNLSAMSATERTAFIANTSGNACIAYELRGDGTMITPSRWAWLQGPLRRIGWAAAMLAAALPFLSGCANRRVLGKIARPPAGSKADVTQKESSTMLLGSPVNRPH